jgi:hypothetical protein
MNLLYCLKKNYTYMTEAFKHDRFISFKHQITKYQWYFTGKICLVRCVGLLRYPYYMTLFMDKPWPRCFVILDRRQKNIYLPPLMLLLWAVYGRVVQGWGPRAFISWLVITYINSRTSCSINPSVPCEKTVSETDWLCADAIKPL